MKAMFVRFAVGLIKRRWPIAGAVAGCVASYLLGVEVTDRTNAAPDPAPVAAEVEPAPTGDGTDSAFTVREINTHGVWWKPTFDVDAFADEVESAIDKAESDAGAKREPSAPWWRPLKRWRSRLGNN